MIKKTVRFAKRCSALTPPPPLPKTSFTYVVYVCSDILYSKGLLGSKWGKAPKTNWYDTKFNFLMTNVMFHACYVRMRWKNRLKVRSVLNMPSL